MTCPKHGCCRAQQSRWEQAHLENPQQPDFEQADLFLGLDDQKGGTLLAPELKKHVAEELARESAILKERRKAKEAKSAAPPKK